MGNEAREIVGEVDCPYCRERSLVKKNTKGKLYFVCTEHGINHMNTPSGQDWILNNMRSRKAAAAAPEEPAPVDPPQIQAPEHEPVDPQPVVASVPESPDPVVVDPPIVSVQPKQTPKRRPPAKKPTPPAAPARTWIDDL